MATQNKYFLYFSENNKLSSDWHIQHPKLVDLSFNKEDKIKFKFEFTDKKGSYFQQGEQILEKCTPLLNALAINKCQKYNLTTTLKKDSNAEIELWVIEYDEAERIRHTYAKLYRNNNSVEFTTSPSTKYIRLAFKLSGQGFIELSPLTISETDKSTEIIKAKESKAQITTTQTNIPLDDIKNELQNKYKESIVTRNSVEYRLGKAILELLNNPKAIWQLPKKIYNLHKSYKQGSPLTKGLQQQYKDYQKALDIRFAKYKVVNKPPEEKKNLINWDEFTPYYKDFNKNKKLKIACIMDTFTYECFQYEADLLPLTKEWQKELEKFKPDFIFLESAWHGHNSQWKFFLSAYHKSYAQRLRDLVSYARKNKIPLVFWNKEDPVNYNYFIDLAKQCDYVFTTDENIIPQYKKDVGHDKVYALPFACQPIIHNPIHKSSHDTYDVCFAGSWYNQGHDERKKFMQTVLDGSLKRNLHIYDRMYFSKENNESRIFPQKYQKFIVGGLDYKQMLTAYRQYNVFLNINTVFDSPTMFSRRVFEILACNTNVVSTISSGMQEMLKEHVYVAHNTKEIDKHLKSLLQTPAKREEKAHIASRYVLNNHTYRHRLNYICKQISKRNREYYYDDKLISVVTVTNRPKYITNLLQNYKRQNHKNKELILVMNTLKVNLDDIKAKCNKYKIKNYKVFAIEDEKTLGHCLNEAIKQSQGDFITKMDDDDLYGAEYLSDIITAFDYSSADVVGKFSFFSYLESTDSLYLRFSGEDNKYSDFVSGGTITFRKEVFDKVKFPDKNRGEDSQFLKDCKTNKFKIYSCDKYNHIQVRRKNLASHTWHIDENEYLKNCQKVADGLQLDLVFI